MRAFHQGLFWERVDRKLKRLTLKPLLEFQYIKKSGLAALIQGTVRPLP
jgi:NaMN:DMB phosphoribosyltransferase